MATSLSPLGMMSTMSYTNATNATNATAITCQAALKLDDVFVIYMAGPAVLIILLLSFLKKRKSLCQSCCSARPALVYPINFVEEYEHRWAYAAAFGIMSYRVLYMFEGGFYFTKADFNSDPTFYENFSWISVFIQAFNVFWVAMVFYPLFVCLGLGYHFIANILGLAYTTVWIVVIILVNLACISTWSNESTEFKNSMEWNLVIIENLVFDVPVALCYIVLIVTFFSDIYRNCKRVCARSQVESADQTEPRMPWKQNTGPAELKMSWSSNYADTPMMESQPMQYLKGLLKREKKELTSIKEKVIQKAKYENIAGYRYSPRLLCTMIVSWFAVYKIGMRLALELEFTLLQYLKNRPAEILLYIGIESSSPYFWYTMDALVVARAGFHVSNVIALIAHFASMVHIILMYRKNVQRLFRGKTPWKFKYQSSPAFELVAGLRYSGYQVAFMIHGFFIMVGLLFLIIVAFSCLIVLPLKHQVFLFVINLIIRLWPTILISLIIYVIQVVVCKFIFLQERGASLGLNNRRGFHVFTFFMFFYNVLLGLFSCLKRIIFSMVFGTILISRLDFCLLVHGFERFDAGYKAYIGILRLDVQHNHPLLKAFLMIMAETVHNRHHSGMNGAAGAELADIKQRSSTGVKARARWRKAYTLLKNPTLVLDRIKVIQKEERKTVDVVVDTIADVLGSAGAVTVGSMMLGGAQAATSSITHM